MDRDRLVLGLASVFAGITVLLVVLAFVRQLFLLFVALPFGATAYIMWQHATGRLADRARRRARRRSADERRAPGGVGATARRTARNGRATRGDRTTRNGQTSTRDTLTRRDAYETLDLDPGASDEAVRRAYRAKVKEVHPDTDAGDEEAFKRVNRAYELLRE
ncbi:MAG: J domain-containing protein [Haloplanus sp.]